MGPTDGAGSAKRDAIVRAATTLFSRYGYRKTTVELIAREAEVAKPTVYAHFADKDAVFVAVCQDVMDRIVAAARAAQDRADVVERLTAMLSAKFTTVYELVDSSPHAGELLESRNAEAHRVVEVADAAYLELLTAAIRTAARRGELRLDRFGGKAANLARVLMQAGHGASYGAASADAHRANLDGLVRAIVGVPVG